jgi:hypothetical protein
LAACCFFFVVCCSPTLHPTVTPCPTDSSSSPLPPTPKKYLAEVDPARRRLLDDVKGNTMRYIGIAAEAADEAMPPPEGLPQSDIFDRLLESVRCCCWVFWGGGETVGAGAFFFN